MVAADERLAGGQGEAVRGAIDSLTLALKWMLDMGSLLTLQSDTACGHLLLDMVFDLRDNPLVEGLASAYRSAVTLGTACTDAALLGSWAENQNLVAGAGLGAVNYVKRREGHRRRRGKVLESGHVNLTTAERESRA